MFYGIEIEDIGGLWHVVEKNEVAVTDLDALVEYGQQRKGELQEAWPLAQNWRIIHYSDNTFLGRVDDRPLA